MENTEVYITSKEEKNRRNFGEVIIYNVVFNPFFSRFGLPLHNTPFPGFLMKSIGALFSTGYPSWCQLYVYYIYI